MNGSCSLDLSSIAQVGSIRPLSFEWWEEDAILRIFVCNVAGAERRICFDIQKWGANNCILPLDHFEDPRQEADFQNLIPAIDAKLREHYKIDSTAA